MHRSRLRRARVALPLRLSPTPRSSRPTPRNPSENAELRRASSQPGEGHPPPGRRQALAPAVGRIRRSRLRSRPSRRLSRTHGRRAVQTLRRPGQSRRSPSGVPPEHARGAPRTRRACRRGGTRSRAGHARASRRGRSAGCRAPPRAFRATAPARRCEARLGPLSQREAMLRLPASSRSPAGSSASRSTAYPRMVSSMRKRAPRPRRRSGEALVDQRGERVEIRIADGLRGLERPPAREDGQAAEQPLFLGSSRS